VAPGDHVNDGTVLGLDNVPIGLPLGSLGSRALAAFLDYALLAVLMAGWVVGVIVLGRGLGFAWTAALLLVGMFVIDYGYFAGLELVLGGRTTGKRALGLRVVTRAGGRPGAASLLLRNVVRSVDLVVGVPLMALDPASRRLGDRLAGTLVVHERPREPEIVVRRVPAGWGGREVAVMESYFRRRNELDAPFAESLGRRLVALVRRDDPVLLQGVPEVDPDETLRVALGIEGITERRA
jgi:uncharacterized RDD family membrane protein YckC